jgi:hypothetical protein
LVAHRQLPRRQPATPILHPEGMLCRRPHHLRLGRDANEEQGTSRGVAHALKEKHLTGPVATT